MKRNMMRHRLVREELRSRGARTAAVGHCACGETRMAQVRSLDPRGDDAAALRAMRVRFRGHATDTGRRPARDRDPRAWTDDRRERDRRGFVRYCVRMGKAQARPDLRLMWLLDALRGMGRRARIGYSDGGELTARERELVLTARETRTVSALITQPPAPDQRFGRTAAVAA